MPSGMDVRAIITRLNQSADDSVGGAQLTGTTVFQCVASSFQEKAPSMLLVQQGIETQKIAVALVRPATMDVKERDQFKITAPLNHPYVNDDWLIIKVTHPQIPVSRSISQIQLTMRRIQENRRQQI